MLKQDKNRKYNCPVQLAVYGHTVEGTIYLTLPLRLNSYNQHINIQLVFYRADLFWYKVLVHFDFC
jgi:hypothetical protein